MDGWVPTLAHRVPRSTGRTVWLDGEGAPAVSRGTPGTHVRCPLPIVMLCCCALVVALARCAGCSEECAGQRQGSEGCPCQTDQDCTTVGAVLLCVDGSCTPGDPPDAHGPSPCEDDTICAATEACAADATCQPAPACQRLEPNGALTTRARDTTGGCAIDDDCDVGACSASACQPVLSTATIAAATVDAAPQADCGMAIDIAEPAVSATGFFARDGELTAAGCTGRWFAAHRAGFVDCGGQVVALSAPNVTTCIGPECTTGGCRALSDEMGVCP